MTWCVELGYFGPYLWQYVELIMGEFGWMANEDPDQLRVTIELSLNPGYTDMTSGPKPRPAVRGRGAKSNRTGRYESHQHQVFDDGWTDDDAPASIQVETTIAPLRSRTIISRNQSPDIGFERSINPYTGCSHGCSYCYARPSHAYMGLSPGLDFESRIFFKPDAARLLEQELSAKRYVCKRIHIGGNTDSPSPARRSRRVGGA